jgi:ribosome-interacting GTPase 1
VKPHELTRRTDKTKKTAPEKDRAWFKRKVAELKTELEKLPVGRQEQLRRELKERNEE